MPMLGTASVRDLPPGAHALDVAITDGLGGHVTGFDPSKPAVATLTSVVTSTTSALLLAANAARRGFYLHNVSARALHVAYAATATTAAFTFLVPANSGFEGPLQGYTGDISAIHALGTGAAKVTELT